MKKHILLSAAVCMTLGSVTAVFAADDMKGMRMAPAGTGTSGASSRDAALADGVVKKVDIATGMITLKHGPLDNVHMGAMTMAYKAGDATMATKVKPGDAVRFHVDQVNGVYTITRLDKQR